MSKDKISKFGLLSYIDGELGDKSSELVKDYLMENEEDTDFLKSIVEMENLFCEKEPLSVPDELRQKVLNNGNSLLERRVEMIKMKAQKKKSLNKSISEIKSYAPKFKFNLPYEYVALCSLIIIFVSLLKTPTYRGDVIAFEIKPQVVLTETSSEYYANKYNDEGE